MSPRVKLHINLLPIHLKSSSPVVEPSASTGTVHVSARQCWETLQSVS